MNIAARHPLIAALAAATVLAVAAVLAFTLVYLPLAGAALHGYADYSNRVGQMFQQAQQHGGTP